ncbi:MAG TPA: hypothetical protein GX688_00510 [Clostridiales bacterium]|nr:hypothetical protein [Clostridiales bacterium]
MKKVIAWLVLISLVFLMSCDSAQSGEDEWAVYWYLCGSDLETRFGSATDDLIEMLQVELPPGITVVIQTGGAYSWDNDTVDASRLQRYVYDRNGFELVDEIPLASMGQEQVLYDFLVFASERYPAKRTILNIWDHGGGSLAGAAFDELHDMDSLDLGEMTRAVTRALGSDLSAPPLDIIGFDACLMATIDVARSFHGLAHYLVASQDGEPLDGWDYTGMMETLVQKPETTALDLAVSICSTYYEACADSSFADSVTLSVVDLPAASGLFEAYEEFSAELLMAGLQDRKAIAAFTRACSLIDCFGPNSNETGYTNMADLGQMAARMTDVLPRQAGKLQAAMRNCVPYNVRGRYALEAGGLSFYCPFDGSQDNLTAYADLRTAEGINYLYDYMQSGEFNSDMMLFLLGRGYAPASDAEPLLTFDDIYADNHPVYLDQNGAPAMLLHADIMDILASVELQLYRWHDGMLMEMDISDDVSGLWDAGLFRADFTGTGFYLDDSLCSASVLSENERYRTHSVPIYLNGDGCYLRVLYDLDLDRYELGYVESDLHDSGAMQKEIRYLQEGDIVEPIEYVMLGEDFWSRQMNVPGESFTVSPQTSFYRAPLPDGTYWLRFVMTDLSGYVSYSQPAVAAIAGGEIKFSLE